VDFVKDPVEEYPMESKDGIEGLIKAGAEKRFGPGTTEFLREAHERQEYFKTELARRYAIPL
jgi:hypothetical protein